DRQCLTRLHSGLNPFPGLLVGGCHPIDVPGLHPFFYPVGIHVSAKKGRTRERCRKRLSATHSSQTCADEQLSRKVIVEMLRGTSHKGLVGALKYPLATDIDPASRCHLAEHHETLFFQVIEVLPCRPSRDQVAVG